MSSVSKISLRLLNKKNANDVSNFDLIQEPLDHFIWPKYSILEFLGKQVVDIFYTSKSLKYYQLVTKILQVIKICCYYCIN